MPLQQFPFDIIVEIFLAIHLDRQRRIDAIVPGDKDWGSIRYCHAMTKAHAAPWTLGHICQHWRTAALTTPVLRSCIAVMLYDGTRRTTKEALETLLDRSGTSIGLSISLYRRTPAASDPGVVSILNSVSHRWAKLYAYDSIPVSLLAPATPVPMLRQLHMEGSTRFPALLNAQELKTVSGDLDIVLLMDPTTFARITSLDVFQWSLNFQARQTLRKFFETCLPEMTALVHLSLYHVAVEDPVAQVTLPHLTSLSLSELVGEEGDILASLILPSLTSLTLSTPIPTSIANLVNQSECRLLTLTINSDVVMVPTRDQEAADSAAYISMIRLLPDARVLNLGCAWVNPEFLDALLEKGGDGEWVVCPSLEHLSGLFCDVPNQADDMEARVRTLEKLRPELKIEEIVTMEEED